MTDHQAIELQQKLAQLDKQRHKIQQNSLWRAAVVSTFAGTILAALFSPYWQIKERSQIQIKSDRFLNSLAIYDTLNIAYPQSILTVPTQQIKNQLEKVTVLQSVQVTKTIFPPSINIYLKERVPVVTAMSEGKVGYLDHQGVWLDPQVYNYQHPDVPLTSIKVVNFKSQYSKVWSQLYALINTYPTIEVREVHWNEQGDLLLVTKKHQIILGSDYALLNDQFAVLASFPASDNNYRLKGIIEIDLTNPQTPFINHNLDL